MRSPIETDGHMTRLGRWIFDAAVLVALASGAWMAVDGNWDAVVRFAVIAGFMVAARAADVPPTFAAAFAVLVLLATWAAVQHWYRQVTHFDVLVHYLTPGSLAAVTYFVLVPASLLPTARSSSPYLRSWAPVLWRPWPASRWRWCGSSASGSSSRSTPAG